MAVAELKNINSASSNENLKIGKFKSAPQTKGGTEVAEIFFGDSLFYALQHSKIWSNSKRSSHKSEWKVNTQPIALAVSFLNAVLKFF